MQTHYHGIASYKFEYKKSSETNWINAKEEPSNNTSYGYTYSGLDKGTEYNLRATITDNAGNSKTSEIKTVSTKKRNESGTIEDIITDDIIYPGQNSALITTNVGKTVEYTFTPKTATFSADLTGASTTYTSSNNITWRVWAEDSENTFLIGVGSTITLKGANGWNNGVGLLDSLCEYCYGDNGLTGIFVRNMKTLDWKSGSNLTFHSSQTENYRFTWPNLHSVILEGGYYKSDLGLSLQPACSVGTSSRGKHGHGMVYGI